MMKKFIKDNRGQVLYAVIVTVMFMGTISMITMGLTLSNYRAALQKQQHVTDYYAADAVAELIRMDELSVAFDEAGIAKINAETYDIADESTTSVITVLKEDNTYTITTDTATIKMTIVEVEDNGTKYNVFKSWEVSYHAEQPAE